MIYPLINFSLQLNSQRNNVKKQQVNAGKKPDRLSFLFGRYTFLLCLLLIITFLIYSKSLHYEFLSWDDDKQITENSLIKKINPETFKDLYRFDKHTSLSLLTYALNYHFSGLETFSYRIVNLFLHLLNVILTFALVFKILHNKKIALIAAILFALHPMRVESVVWISERKDLLFTFLSFSALLVYLKYLKQNKAIYFITAFLLCYLASLSKIQAVALPVLFLALDIYYSRKIGYLAIFEKFILVYSVFFFDLVSHNQFPRIYDMPAMIGLWILFYFSTKKLQQNYSLKHVYTTGFLIIIFCAFAKERIVLIPFVLWWSYDVFKNKIELIRRFEKIILKYKYVFTVLCIGSFATLLFIQNKFAFWHADEASNKIFNFIDRLFLASYSLSFYITKAIAPINLNAIYSYPLKSNGLLPAAYYISLPMILLLFGALIWFYLKRIQNLKKEILLFFVFFIINISLVLHIIPIEGRLVTSDRYSYFAYLGLFVLAGVGFENIKERLQTISHKRIATGLTYLVLLCFTITTFFRIPVWENNLTLFSDALQKNPDISFAHSNLGAAYLHTGDQKKTFFHLNRAVKLDTSFELAYYNRAMAYFQFRQYDKSINDLNKLFTLQHDSLDLAIDYNDRAMVKLEAGDLKGAWSDIDKSLKFNPKFAKAYNNRSKLRYTTNNVDSAITDCNTALLLNPYLDEGFTNRGWCWVLKGDLNKAMDDFNMAVKINPKNEKAFTNRGTLKINLKDLNGAIKDLSTALEINPKFEFAYANRGYAWFIIGNLENTIKDYTSAIKLNSSNIELYTNRGWAYFKSGDFHNALKDYEMANAMQPKNNIIYTNRGWIKFQNKDTTGAIDDFKQALLINDKSEKALLYRAIINYYRKKYYLAIQDLDKVISINIKNGEAFYYRGLCKYEQKIKKKACKDLQLAIDNGYEKAKVIIEEKCK